MSTEILEIEMVSCHNDRVTKKLLKPTVINQ